MSYLKKELTETSDTFYSKKSTQAQAPEPSLFNQINGFEDRLVITVDIKVSGYKNYSLDAQIDTGAMNSCAKYGAIPSYL